MEKVRIIVRLIVDGSFHAIATILHRVPRDAADLRNRRKAGSPRQGDRDTDRDIPEGWVRFAL